MGAFEGAVAFNGFAMNDSPREFNGSGYYSTVEDIDGLFISDWEQEVEKIPQGVGQRAFDPFIAGNTLTVSGEVYGKSMTAIRTFEVGLKAACWDKQEHQLLMTVAAVGAIYINCATAQNPSVTIDKSQRWPVKAAYVFALRADNPRYYYQAGGGLVFGWMA